MAKRKLPAYVIAYRPPALPPAHSRTMMLDGHQRLALIDLPQKMWSQIHSLQNGIELVLDIAGRDEPPRLRNRGSAVIAPFTGPLAAG